MNGGRVGQLSPRRLEELALQLTKLQSGHSLTVRDRETIKLTVDVFKFYRISDTPRLDGFDELTVLDEVNVRVLQRAGMRLFRFVYNELNPLSEQPPRGDEETPRDAREGGGDV